MINPVANKAIEVKKDGPLMKFFLTVKYKKKTICDQCNAF
jgi:hypothetical protein